MECIIVDDVSYSEGQLGDTWSIENCPDAYFSQNTDCSLSINDNKIVLFSILPNPVENEFTISSNTAVDLIEIYNLQGALIIQNSFRFSMDMSGLSSGLYFMKVYSGNEKSVRKFVKK